MIAKPLDQITPADIAELCAHGGAYESLALELKRELPGRDGRPDPWTAGGDFSNYARDRLFREVVAFANAQGGTLVLGIAETKDEPKRAAEIVPIPRVHDLAARLEAAARACIDPPLASLQIRGIVTEGSDAGVVVFRTVGSPFGPHQVTSDGHAFIRRGSSSVKMTMREIQDLTLDLARRGDRLDAQFEDRASAFTQWFRYSNLAEKGGLRVTAVPLDRLPKAIRTADHLDRFTLKRDFRIGFEDGRQIELARPPHFPNSRPVLRGYRFYYDRDGDAAQLDILDSGVVDFWSRCTVRERRHLRTESVLTTFLAVLKHVDSLRALAEAPEWEFGIEVAFDGLTAAPAPPDARVALSAIVIVDFAERAIQLPGPPIRFPRLASRSPSDEEELLNLVFRDLIDAAGDRSVLPRMTLLG